MTSTIEVGTGEKKRRILKEWEEVQGRFKGITEEDSRIYVHLADFELIFNLESQEAENLKKKLVGVKYGSRISLLKTDLPKKPILIQLDKRAKGAFPTSSPTKARGVRI